MQLCVCINALPRVLMPEARFPMRDANFVKIRKLDFLFLCEQNGSFERQLKAEIGEFLLCTPNLAICATFKTKKWKGEGLPLQECNLIEEARFVM